MALDVMGDSHSPYGLSIMVDDEVVAVVDELKN